MAYGSGMHLDPPSSEAIAALAPTGTLRAAINLSNFLLVVRTEEDGTPIGPSPDMATALADALDVPVELTTYPSPGAVTDAAVEGLWDVGNIGAEPARAVHIDFSAAYAEIEATLMVPEESDAQSLADLDQPGMRISVKGRAAYAVWLEANIEHAELVLSDRLDASFETFASQGLDANAGLRPKLAEDLVKTKEDADLPAARLLDGSFMTVKQAMGTPKGRDGAGFEYLAAFVEHAKTSGFVAESIARHGVDGRLSVAPLRA